MAGLAPCALICIEKAIGNSTCSLLDTACHCSNTALTLLVSSCIATTCTVREALGAWSFVSRQCGISPLVNHSFVAPMSVLLALASIAVFLRLVARVKHNTKLWWDDLCNFLALLAGAALFGAVIKMTNLGLGTDIWAVSPDNITPFFKIAYSCFQLYEICRFLIRSSIILFYLRIFKLIAPRLLWGAFAANLVVWITGFFLSTFQCSPVSYFWNKWDGEHHGHCFTVFVSWFGAAIDLAQDLVLLLLPFPYLRTLRLELKKKVAALIMFSVGSITIAFSIFRLTTILKYIGSVKTISTLDTVPLMLWSTLELYTGIICACLPSIYPLARPLFARLDNMFSHKEATTPPYTGSPSEEPYSRKKHTQKEKKKYRPNWDITLSAVSMKNGVEIEEVITSHLDITDSEMDPRHLNPSDPLAIQSILGVKGHDLDGSV